MCSKKYILAIVDPKSLNSTRIDTIIDSDLSQWQYTLGYFIINRSMPTTRYPAAWS
jgi:hypothetical protein